MSLVIYIGNTTVIELVTLTNVVTGSAITNATVVLTINDAKTGLPVTGQTWPLTLSHVSAGTYRATIENDIILVEQGAYDAVIDASVSGVGSARWRASITPVRRTE